MSEMQILKDKLLSQTQSGADGLLEKGHSFPYDRNLCLPNGMRMLHLSNSSLIDGPPLLVSNVIYKFVINHSGMFIIIHYW